MFPYDTPTDFMTTWSKPTGSDIIDWAKEEYLKHIDTAESTECDNRRPQ